MKRGQLDQPFIIIFALVVASVILILGYYSISGLIKTADSVETAKFYNDLKKNVETYYNYASGTNAQIKLNVPEGITGVCFVELNSVDEGDIKYKGVAEDVSAFKKTADYNVFFSIKENIKPISPLRIEKLKPKENPICKDTIGRLEIVLTNKGSYVEVS